MNLSVLIPIVLWSALGYAQECVPSASPPDPESKCCGITSIGTDKIIPEFFASLGEYPWMGIIEYEKGNQTKLLCNAILISGRYAISAGQCFSKIAALLGTPVNVRFGEHDTSNEGEDCVETESSYTECNDGALSIPIEKVITHPEYNNNKDHQNDIALIKLATLAPYTDFIRPICLPTSDVTVNDSRSLKMVVAGWGAVNSTTFKTNVLHHVNVPFVDFDTCQNTYTARHGPRLGNGQLCAGGNGKDSCKGDSGGPLMLLKDGATEVAGIVSFGPVPCGLEGVPGVYTKVFAYDSWIRENIEN